MQFTVFCQISNNFKNHAFWQTIQIWFEDNFTFLDPWGGEIFSSSFSASNSEHLPVFRAPREGKGRFAPVHGRGTLRLGPRKKLHGTHRQTDIATTIPNRLSNKNWQLVKGFQFVLVLFSSYYFSNKTILIALVIMHTGRPSEAGRGKWHFLRQILLI